MRCKKWILLIGILAVMAIAGFVLYYKYGMRDYVVSVNGEKVGVGEFKFILSLVKEEIKQKEVENFNIDGKNDKELAKERALESIIRYKLGVQQAKKQGIKLTSQEMENINKQIDEVISKNPEVTKILKDSGLTVNDFKRINMELSIANKCISQAIKTINISDREAKDYYNKNIEDYTYNQEMVRVRHVLIKTTDEKGNELPKEQQNELRKKAEQILQKAKSGEDFALLAKQYSEDLGSKDNGGEYVFPRGQMVKEFEDAAFALKPGEISDIVKTKYGFHIIKLEEKFDKGQRKSFELVKDDIKAKIQHDKILREWKKNSNIIKNDEIYNSI